MSGAITNQDRGAIRRIFEKTKAQTDFCGEMAVRLACYAISVVPIERQAELLEIVQSSLPGAFAERLRQGAVIHTMWETNGVEHPNVPAAGEVQ